MVGYVHPGVYHLPTHPGVHLSPAHPASPSCRRTVACPVTALTRGFAERTVTDERVSVSPRVPLYFPVSLLVDVVLLLLISPHWAVGRGHVAKSVACSPCPVSLLGKLSYVTEYQVLVSYEGIRRLYVGRLVSLHITRFTVRR